MVRLETLISIAKKPQKAIAPLGARGLFNWLPDKPYLKLLYFAETGKRLDLENPKTYNEKLQWIKIHDRKPEYTKFADKFAVRSFVKEKIGEEYLIPLINVYDRVEDIDWDALPDQFVLKCTHGSGTNIVCPNKSQLDTKAAETKLKNWMKKNWHWFGREWCYKEIKPRIICEKFMVDESGKELKDYKIFCFDGEPRLIQVDFGRYSKHKRNLYTTDWKYIDAIIKYPNDKTIIIPKPERLTDMLKSSEKLSKGIPHVRVDFYSIIDKTYFGEMTFYHGSGFESFSPESLGIEMGNWINLPSYSVQYHTRKE